MAPVHDADFFKDIKHNIREWPFSKDTQKNQVEINDVKKPIRAQLDLTNRLIDDIFINVNKYKGRMYSKITSEISVILEEKDFKADKLFSEIFT